MKLLARYNRVNLVTTIIVMLITGAVYYSAISYILTSQKDKDLVVEEREIFDYVKLNNELPQTFESNDQQITFTPAAVGSVQRKFIDTRYFEKFEGRRKHEHGGGEYESGRGLVSSITVGDKYYKILIIVSKVETEYLIRIIFYITAGVILLLLVVLGLTNRLILGRLWQPFYTIMGELRLFNVADKHEVPLLKTSIDEFNELNTAVSDMTAKAHNDYYQLKAFTENAAHELLTPIAVINSKLDTLIQTENFSGEQSRLLNDLYSAASRLNRLNQSLLLLVKIENRLMPDKQSLNLGELIEEMLMQFEEIFQDKGLKVSHTLVKKEITASGYLAEILLSNLISNAVRHNHIGGEIDINLTSGSLIIKNTGENEALPDEKIFTRFHKSSSSEGSGLGLTISKEICENFGYRLEYRFERGYHVFEIKFA